MGDLGVCVYSVNKFQMNIKQLKYWAIREAGHSHLEELGSCRKWHVSFILKEVNNSLRWELGENVFRA